jgi:hypothetical protein
VKRRLLNLLTLLSLLLCIAACALWVRGYWRNDQFGWSRIRYDQRPPTPSPRAVWRGHGDWTTWRYAKVESAAGVLDFDVGVQAFDFTTSEMPEGGGFFWEADEWAVARNVSGGRPWRWGYGRKAEPGSRMVSVGMMMPTWALALAAAVAPAALCLMRGAALRRRRRKGRCPKCGYDLRATPERCPECGSASRQACA